MSRPHAALLGILAAFAAMLLLLSGCGTGPSGAATGDLQINITTQTATATQGSSAAVPLATDLPSGVTQIAAQVTSATASNPSKQTVPVAQGSVLFQGLLVASDYVVTVDALDGSGNSICSGSESSIAVTAGAAASVVVPMQCSGSSTGGQIDASWATHLTVGAAAAQDSVAQYAEDWYNFDVPAAESITVTVTPSSGNADLYVFSSTDAFNTDGTFKRASLVDSSANTGADSVQFSASAQRYYVMIYGQTAADYTVGVTTP